MSQTKELKLTLTKAYSDSLLLKKATNDDCTNILNIIDLNHVSKVKDESRGFLCHNPGFDELNYRLAFGLHNQVATYNGKTIGFLTAFSNAEAQQYLNLGFLKYEKAVIDSLANNDFIWLDQLAVYPPKYYRNKIGTRLISNIIEKTYEMGFRNFYGTISVHPETNLASINFMGSLGFTMKDTLYLNGRKWTLTELTV